MGRCSILEFQPKNEKKNQTHYFDYFTLIFLVNFVCAVGEGTIGTSE